MTTEKNRVVWSGIRNAVVSTASIMERIMKENALKIFIYRILPKSMLSRLFGAVTRVPMPGWFLKRLHTLVFREVRGEHR